MTQYEKPASRVSRAGLSVVHVSGGTGTKIAENPSKLNGNDPRADHPWSMAREYERQSIDRAREALLMRGNDRFQSLSIACALGLAARDTALIAGAMQ